MADAKITYKSGVIAEINGGQTATLKCKGMKMDDDVTVESLGSGGTDERFKQLVEGTLTEVNDSEITTTKSYAFYACSNLVNVRLPNITKVGDSSFSNCKAMISFCALNVTEVGYSSFSYCENLKEVIFPKLRTIGQTSFRNSKRLETADLGTAEQMGSSILADCYSLKAVIFRKTGTILTMTYSDVFKNCHHIHGTTNSTYNPQGLKDGYIYVPSALIEEYKVATNWVIFADQFRALEDYTVDGTTTGELDWEKVNA